MTSPVARRSTTSTTATTATTATAATVSRTPTRTRLTLVLAALVTATATLLLAAAPAAGQGTQFSVLGGATFSELRGAEGLESRSGAMAGISLLFPLGGPLAFQPEALLVSRGADAGSGILDDARAVDISALEVPLLLRFSFAPRSTLTPHLYAGPYLALQVDCEVEGTSTDCDDLPGLSTNTVDVGGIAGGGVSLGVGPLVLTGGLRYGFGVSTLAEVGEAEFRESARHGGWGIYLGAGFRIGGE